VILTNTFARLIPFPCKYALYLTAPPFVLFNCVDALDAMVYFSTQLPSILNDWNSLIGVDGVTFVPMDDHFLMVPLKLHDQI